MTRFLRWISVSALALLATIVLLPQPASAAVGVVPCGQNCLAQALDAVCWEKEWCAVKVEVKGTPAAGTVVNYRTANGTAAAPGDFIAVPSAELPLMAEGVTQLGVFVAGDAVRERDEMFTVEFVDRDGRVLATASIVVRDHSAR
ncbi:Calx-beta domain-containing protein [Catellatospora aurea]|uniref:Calx-beta domain-containing protein n=1 Tax=Catellatospora aurea TaxID=1337874 RepID=A0ABW2H3Y8_9ACTN